MFTHLSSTLEKKYLIIFLFSFIFLSTNLNSETVATITHNTGDTIKLTDISTYAITLNTSGNNQIVKIKSIKNMNRTKSKNTFEVILISGEKIVGTSVSTIEGVWELGKYKNNFSKIKSLNILSTKPDKSWKKPSGYVAEIIEKNGTVSEVYGVKLYRSYSKYNPFVVLPVDPGCGTLLVPFKNILSITNIKGSKYKDKYATITFTDGNVINGKIFDYNINIRDVKGTTKNGEFKKSISTISKILFKHENYINPAAKYNYGKKRSNLKATITCSSGFQINLKNVLIYNSPTKSYSKSRLNLEIKLGEADNKVDLNKIVEISKVKNSNKEAILKTKSGTTVRVILKWYSTRYVGGNNEDGLFYYISLKNLNKIRFTK